MTPKRYYKGLESKRLRCPHRGCGRPAAGSGRWCIPHKNALYRLGHQDAKTIRRAQYERFLPEALEHVRHTAETEATKAAVDALDRALSPAFIPDDPRYSKVTAALARLRQNTKRDGRKHHEPVTVPEMLAEMCAFYVYWTQNPGLEGVYWILATRAILRLKPRAIYASTINPKTWRQEAQYDQGLSAKALKILADRLSDSVKLYVVGYVHVLAERKRGEEALRLAAQGFASVDEEFEAKLNEARDTIKPKKAITADSNPADLIPWNATEAERQIIIKTLHAAYQRQEASSS
jgi:hypothetical protein